MFQQKSKTTVLFALGLSVKASEKLYKIQKEIYKRNKQLEALALPPLIPLLWSNQNSVVFEKLVFEKMPKLISFETLSSIDSDLYLTCASTKWSSVINRLRTTLLENNIEEKTNLIPFNANDGIYLGKSCPSLPEIEPIINNDWRFYKIECNYTLIKNRLINFNHRFLWDHHLTKKS